MPARGVASPVEVGVQIRVLGPQELRALAGLEPGTGDPHHRWDVTAEAGLHPRRLHSEAGSSGQHPEEAVAELAECLVASSSARASRKTLRTEHLPRGSSSRSSQRGTVNVFWLPRITRLQHWAPVGYLAATEQFDRPRRGRAGGSRRRFRAVGPAAGIVTGGGSCRCLLPWPTRPPPTAGA